MSSNVSPHDARESGARVKRDARLYCAGIVAKLRPTFLELECQTQNYPTVRN